MKALAKITGISQPALSDVENGKYDFSGKKLTSLLQNTDINIHWLLTGEGEMLSTDDLIVREDQDIFEKCCGGKRFIAEDDARIFNRLLAAKKILESHTVYSKALSENIEAFLSAIEQNERISRLENKVEIEKKFNQDLYDALVTALKHYDNEHDRREAAEEALKKISEKVNLEFKSWLSRWLDLDYREMKDRIWSIPVVHYLFRPVKSLKRSWATAKRRAGITRELRPYDLRHAFATLALEAGADLKAVSELIGHSRPDTTMRVYQHVNRRQHREAVAKIPSLGKGPGPERI